MRRIRLGLLPSTTVLLLTLLLTVGLGISTLVSFAQDAAFVPPVPGTSTDPEAADSAVSVNDGYIIASRDSVLGDRIARISATMEKIPQEHGQIWREYDITPFTKERKLPMDTIPPEQMLVDWIVRRTGAKVWNTAPFGILTADSEKLYVYHTKEVQLIVADIVDRFVCTQLWNEGCTVRVISTPRPDWLTRGHALLKPIPIATQGVQGWVMEKTSAQSILQELTRRSDFRELIPPQPFLSHGLQHHVAVTKQRNYLRDIQPNPSMLYGYAEDRVSLDEGVGFSMTPLALLDGRHMAAALKLDVVQIERMFTTTIEIPNAKNIRQRVKIESPQIASFRLDEVVAFPKDKVLLLDLGTIPLPNTAEENSKNVIAEISRGINPARRGNVLILIECTTSGVAPSVTAQQPTASPAPVRSARGGESPYWQGIR